MDQQDYNRIVRDELAEILLDFLSLKRKIFSTGNECQIRLTFAHYNRMKQEAILKNNGDISYKWEYENVKTWINDTAEKLQSMLEELNKLIEFPNKYPIDKSSTE